ncbi:hypothetical protein M2335_001236 [Sphingobium sp. B12D2B]|nr:hypothetical protein [Sphingobium sp. B12D2B]
MGGAIAISVGKIARRAALQALDLTKNMDRLGPRWRVPCATEVEPSSPNSARMVEILAYGMLRPRERPRIMPN